MKNIICIMFILLLSCNSKEKIEIVNITNPIILKDGEFYSKSYPQNGISIRGNKIAFFEKMKFEGKDIYEFIIVDSISIKNKVKTNFASYIKRTNNKDTICNEILKLKDSTIVLKRNNQTEEFNLKSKITFKSKNN